MPTTGFITGFVARLSEKLVGKARGEKGSEACSCTVRTLFAENADPRALQPIAAECSYETIVAFPLEHDEFYGAPVCIPLRVLTIEPAKEIECLVQKDALRRH